MSDPIPEVLHQALGPAPAPQQADAEALAEIYRQGVESGAASPGIGEYVRDTLIFSLSRFFDWLSGVTGLFSGLHLGLLRIVFTVVLFALLLFLLVQLLRRVLRRRRVSSGDGRVTSGPARRPAAKAHDWADELRQRLARGDVAGALEALWWWLATAVGMPSADPAWTSGELLRHAGRGDLRRPVRRLDHLIYGPELPRPADVEALWQALRPLVEPPPVDAP